MAVVSINTYTQTVTPELARIWLGFIYEKQRDLRRDQVEKLADAIRRGQFTTNTMKFVMLNMERYLINGQHTLHAIIKSGVTIVLPVIDFVVDTGDDLARLYYHEDTNRKRNFADSVKATDLAQTTSLTKSQIKYVANGLKWAKANFGADRNVMDYISQDDLLAMVPVWAWETRALYMAITPCGGLERNIILKQPVFSVALMTMRYAPDKAREFWRQVAQDDGLERYDARKTIMQWLKKNSVRQSPTPTRIMGNVVSRAVALAWNAWCEERTLKYIQVQNTTALLALRHTTFNGKQGRNFVPLSDSPNIGKSVADVGQGAIFA